MIVTFHLAVYFVYYVWNKYISCENERFPTSNDNNQTNPTSQASSNETESGGKPGSFNDSPDRETTTQNNLSENPNLNNKKHDSKQAREGEGDFHPCLPQILSDEEDRGNDLIYNVEPEYDCICSEEKIQFFPPVYIQRYMEIERILKEPRWAQTVKKVVDFGCAELNFEMKYLKKLHGIEVIVAVDIDLETLEKNCFKISPLPTDYLKKRPRPLSVHVFCGSVAHTHDSLTGVDAVIAIELIEHLFPPELDHLPFTVFGFIKPKIAIFTTPNADFNVLFKRMTGFRHPDHKFEWSQQQFEDWGHNLVQRYPDYQVAFKGIGPGPTGSEKYGCCSQMAIFIRFDESFSIPKDEIHVQDGPYTLVREDDFPFFIDERSDEEKVRDKAEWFITNCRMRIKSSDCLKNEISIKSVMERIKYNDREKLKRMLTASGWEITINSTGEEVIVFPDSEEEEEDSLSSESEYNEYIIGNPENVHKDNTNNSPLFEENWDREEVVEVEKCTLIDDLCNNQICQQSDLSDDNTCVVDESYHRVGIVNTDTDIVDSTNIEKISSDRLKLSPNEKCFTSENVVPDIELSDKLYTSHLESFQEKDTNLNFEKSIYQTPYNNGLSNSLKSDCDLYNCSLPSSEHLVKDCKRALVMESPKGFTQYGADPQNEDPFCCESTVSSCCDTSVYTTPCCSQRHRNNIPKCLSLQQISTHCSSPVLSTEIDSTLKDGKLIREHKDKFSKSMEGFKSLENDLTCSSISKVVDSGYPDSYSEYNMDMDLTPEQIEDIESESEEDDGSSRSLSPPPPPPQFPWVMDDVQNGDVANNNRDGEGNNLVADMEEEPLEFEARIDEINNDVMNLAAANDEINFDCDLKSKEPVHEICGDHCVQCISDPPSLSDMTNDHPCLSQKSPYCDLLKLKSVFTENNSEMLHDSLDKQSLRSTKSDTSISTNYSWILDSPGSQTNSNSGGVNNHHTKQTLKLKTHNSLTTILDGHSKFSNCSLVRPVEVYQFSGQENNSSSKLSISAPSEGREHAQQGSTSDILTATSITSTQLEDVRQSLISVYQSAESLNIQNESHVETTPFPDWLLNILLSDVNEQEVESVDSVQSVWDSDSLEERLDLNYDVQVDARGGGDPQRDTWH